MSRPLPEHGTYARGNGAPGYREPCPCEPCYRAMRRGRKQYKVNRQLGRPGLIDATPARERLNILRQTMTWGQIFAATGYDARNLQQIAGGHQDRIRRGTLVGILAIQHEPPAPGKYIDATGVRRRVQALRAIGWSAKSIATAASSAEARIQLISSGEQPTVRYVLAEKIIRVFVDLHRTPAPPGSSATRTRNHANRNGWAPPGAWDDIDDPAARPDWTGHCGTDHGWWTHRLENLPTCPRCENAHETWKTEHRHLPNTEFMQALAAARSAASHRGADIADDGRELLRHGCDYDTAAARIGVTRQHLQQELQRHPEQVAA